MPRFVLSVLGFLISATPAVAVTPWVHDDWQMRVPFSANAALIEGSETFEDFALLVTLDGVRQPDVFANAKSDGSDLLFASAQGAAILDREIVSYDPIGETAEIWVRVPALSKVANEFYLYFDNPLASLDPKPTTAWGEDYRAVYHFEEDPADLLLPDSSPAQVDITLNTLDHPWVVGNWTSDVAESAKIGRGWRFDGLTHHIHSRQIAVYDTSYTVEAWLTHDKIGTKFIFHDEFGWWHLKISGGTEQDNDAGESDYARTAVGLKWEPRFLPLQDVPRHYLWKFDAVEDTILFFYEGQPQEVRGSPTGSIPPYYTTGSLINPNQDKRVGVIGPAYPVIDDLHGGLADEFRLRQGRPSSERILTEFRSADDPAAFLSFDATESVNATSAIAATRLWLRGFPNPSSGPSSVQYSLPSEARIRLSVYDVAGREVASLVDRRMPAGTWVARWDGRSGSGQPVAAGVYFLRLETPAGIRSTKLTLVR